MSESLRTCPACNKSVRPQARFCQACGTPLTAEAGNVANEIAKVQARAAQMNTRKGRSGDIEAEGKRGGAKNKAANSRSTSAFKTKKLETEPEPTPVVNPASGKLRQKSVRLRQTGQFVPPTPSGMAPKSPAKPSAPLAPPPSAGDGEAPPYVPQSGNLPLRQTSAPLPPPPPPPTQPLAEPLPKPPGTQSQRLAKVTSDSRPLPTTGKLATETVEDFAAPTEPTPSEIRRDKRVSAPLPEWAFAPISSSAPTAPLAPTAAASEAVEPAPRSVVEEAQVPYQAPVVGEPAPRETRLEPPDTVLAGRTEPISPFAPTPATVDLSDEAVEQRRAWISQMGGAATGIPEAAVPPPTTAVAAPEPVPTVDWDSGGSDPSRRFVVIALLAFLLMGGMLVVHLLFK